MNERFAELVAYIRHHLEQGYSEHDIRNFVMKYNWDPAMVDEAVRAAKQQPGTTGLSSAASTQAAYYGSAPAAANAGPVQAPVFSSRALEATPDSDRYGIMAAVKDYFAAIRGNPRLYLFAVIVGYAAAFMLLWLMAQLMGLLLPNTLGAILASPGRFMAAATGGLVLYAGWYVVSGALVTVVTSLALYAGNHKVKTSYKVLLTVAAKRLPRVIAADTLFTLIAFWPLFLMFLLPAIILSLGVLAPGNTLPALLGLIFGMVAIIWGLIVIVRLALAPLVVLFEPETPVLASLGRSRRLLREGGQWFITKGLFLLLGIALALMAVMDASSAEVMNTGNYLLQLLLISLSLVIDGVLTMLYLNRYALRDTQR